MRIVLKKDKNTLYVHIGKDLFKQFYTHKGMGVKWVCYGENVLFTKFVESDSKLIKTSFQIRSKSSLLVRIPKSFVRGLGLELETKREVDFNLTDNIGEFTIKKI